MKRKTIDAQVSITTRDVLAWSRRWSQKPTHAEAARWLEKYRGDIEGALRSLVLGHLDEVLYEAAVVALPDPRIDEEFRKIDQAIEESVDTFENAMGLVCYGSEVALGDLLEIACILSTQHPDSFRSCVEMEHLFGPPASDILRSSPTHKTMRVHIIIKSGVVTAELVRNEKCEHGNDFTLSKSHRNRHQNTAKNNISNIT